MRARYLESRPPGAHGRQEQQAEDEEEEEDEREEKEEEDHTERGSVHGHTETLDRWRA